MKESLYLSGSRRNTLAYCGIGIVVVAAGVLAYLGLRYSQQIFRSHHLAAVESMRELASEKVINIEYEMLRAEKEIFQRADYTDRLRLEQIVPGAQAAVVSVFILNAKLELVPNGYLSKRPNATVFRDYFLTHILPVLDLRGRELGQRGHVHIVAGSRSHLFSFVSKRESNTSNRYYVIVEADLAYLVANVFPQYFNIRSRHVYQVLGADGQVIYGPEIPVGKSSAKNIGVVSEDTNTLALHAEVTFPQTTSLWRVRVADRKAPKVVRSQIFFNRLWVLGGLFVLSIGLVALGLALFRERRANNMKSEFVSNVSHDLKTPLSAISMFGEMLATGRVRKDSQVSEYAQIIWDESERLSSLIDNVLDFARLETGKDSVILVPGQIEDVIHRVVEVARPRLGSGTDKNGAMGKVMECTVRCEDPLPEILMDANAFTVALLNIVDNAIKYAWEGGIIMIQAQELSGCVELRISDRGPGLPEKELGRIWDRFYRSKSARLSSVRGTGIGLAIVRQVVFVHRGTVSVKNEEKGGLTFMIRLPLKAKNKQQ